MVPAFHQLYKDLQSTDPTVLLDVNKPAFAFVSQERFTSTRYDNDISEAILQVRPTSVYRAEIIKLIKMVLPSLAAGFLKQKGAMDMERFRKVNTPCREWTVVNWTRLLFTTSSIVS